MEIRITLYGLFKSSVLAAKKLAADLKPYEYYKVSKTNGLWKHKSCPISYTLVVHDFGVSYVNKADAEHLKAVLNAHYPMKID